MSVKQPQRVSVTQVYEQINKVYPPQDPTLAPAREKEYAEVVEIELEKFTKALKKANEGNVDSGVLFTTLYSQGKLEDLFGILFMASKPEHRVSLSYLYDQLNMAFERSRVQLQKGATGSG